MDLMSRAPRSGRLRADRIEPILRRHACEQGRGILAFATEVVGLEQDADGVRSPRAARDRRGVEVRATYVIGADGPVGPTRESLGIRRPASATSHRWSTSIPRRPLPLARRGREGPRLGRQRGPPRRRARARRRTEWLLNTLSYLEGASAGARLDLSRPATCSPRDRRSRRDDRADLGEPWAMNALVADRFRQGASSWPVTPPTDPPTGGFG